MKKLIAIIASLSIIYTTNAQKITLQSLKDSIQKIVEKEQIIGLMVGITNKDSVLFSTGYGFADFENKKKVDSKTLFRMGSNTKMLVALAILKLQEEGKINIHDEIRVIAPEIKFNNKWEATDPLKVVNLLEHTSGFDDMKLNAMYTLEKVEKWDLLTINQASLVCRWRPSERFAYCNPNYNLLGYLIEKFSGKPYNQYITEAILKPLGMTDSNFNLYSKNPLDTKEYIVRNGKIEKIPQVTLIGGPQGSLWSNADDMLRLIQMYLRNGQPIFDKSIIEDIETARSGLGSKNGLESGYGLGNYYTHFYNKYGMRGHNGLVGTCFSTCVYNRKWGFGYVIASNSNNPNLKIEELIRTFLEQDLPKNPRVIQELDTKEIEQYLGFYQFDSPRNEVARLLDKFSFKQQFLIENGDLYEQYFWGQKKKLDQIAPLIFAREGMNIATITFTKNDDGKRVMMMGDTYYEKSSYAWGLLWRGAMILMALLILISGIIAIISLFRAIISNLTWKDFFKQVLPIFSLGFLGFGFSKLLEIQQFSYLLYKLRDVNSDTILIFLSTVFYGIAGLICLYFAFQSFRKNKWFWTLTYGSVFGLAVILFYFNFIGLRTWAM